MIRKALLKKPLLSYFVLTILITWVIWLPLVVYYYRSPFDVSFSSVPIYLILFAFLGFFGPTIASIIMTGMENGSTGIKVLLSNWLKFRKYLKWYLFIFISQILIDFITTQIAINFLSLEVVIDFTKWYNFIPALLRTAIIGGALAEETGWRGYALPRLLSKTTAILSSIIIGIIWALWHLPICLIPSANFPVPISFPVFMVFTINVICISIILTTIYQNTNRSLFVCYLYHVMLNVSLFSSIYKFEQSDRAWWIKICLSTSLHVIISIIFVIFFGSKSLSRNNEIANRKKFA